MLFTRLDSETSLKVIEKFRDMLMDAMRENGWLVTFSIGLVTYNTPPDEVKELIKNTDDLMYSAKQNGKDTIKTMIFN